MKQIGIVGTRGDIPSSAFKTTQQLMKEAGNNTGNLVFQYAVSQLLDEPSVLVGKEMPWDIGAIRARCRILVIPSANFIREGFDLTTLVSFLERVELPLLFVGLGAQATDFDQKTFDFHPSVQRLVDLIRERSAAVSVRGEFTARVLETLGIDTATVTGCPSNFINPTADLGAVVAAKRAARPMRNFITHADEPWPKRREKQAVEKRLAAWTKDGPGIMIQQSVPAVMEFLRNVNPAGETDVPAEREEALRKAMMPETGMEEFRDFLATRYRVYVSVHQWLEDSSKFDFSVGLRLHGNMVAWQAGTPALWIHHDSRTRELAETMALPSMSFEDFIDNCTSVNEAWKRAEFDPNEYDSNRVELSRRLNGVLRTSGVSSVIDARMEGVKESRD